MELPGGGAVRELIELIPFESHAEFQGVKAFSEKSIIVTLKGIPSFVGSRRDQTSQERRESPYQHRGGILPRHRRQRWVSSRRIDRTDVRVMVYEVSIEAEADRIDQSGVKDVVLFEDEDLTLG